MPALSISCCRLWAARRKNQVRFGPALLDTATRVFQKDFKINMHKADLAGFLHDAPMSKFAMSHLGLTSGEWFPSTPAL